MSFIFIYQDIFISNVSSIQIQNIFQDDEIIVLSIPIGESLPEVSDQPIAHDLLSWTFIQRGPTLLYFH